MAEIGVQQENELPVKFQLLAKSISSSFAQDFPSYTEGLVRGQPGGFILSPFYAQNAEKLWSFQPREGDVWLATFPRSGTTWLQQMLWLIVNNCDMEGSKQPLPCRSPYYE